MTTGMGLRFSHSILKYTALRWAFFASDNDREASRFTPLSDPDLYGDGPESEDNYICNYGPYRTKQIALFEIISTTD